MGHESCSRPKVMVAKRQAVDRRPVEVTTHGCINAIEIVLMQDFIGLQIKTPITLASIQGQIGLLGDDQATAANGWSQTV